MNSGVPYREIGKQYGVSKDVVAYFCKLNNISRGGNKNSEEDAARRIHEKTNGKFEYIEGYVNKDSDVLVRCSDCGTLIKRSYHHLTTHCYGCENCRKIERERREAAAKESRENRKREKREAAEQRRLERETPHRCPVCGKLTTNRKYCSKDCRLKANNSAKEVRRRAKVNAVLIDKDISVSGLYKRDKGVCYLCGGRCDLNDYQIRRGTFIAGDSYPSIDHVVPLAKGGVHAWDNVKLAHRRCNYLKRDKNFKRISPPGV